MKRLTKRDILSEGKGRELVLIKYKLTNLEVNKIFYNIIKKIITTWTSRKVHMCISRFSSTVVLNKPTCFENKRVLESKNVSE